jgi:hypothetical protein
MLVNFYQTAWHYNPEDRDLHLSRSISAWMPIQNIVNKVRSCIIKDRKPECRQKVLTDKKSDNMWPWLQHSFPKPHKGLA